MNRQTLLSALVGAAMWLTFASAANAWWRGGFYRGTYFHNPYTLYWSHGLRAYRLQSVYRRILPRRSRLAAYNPYTGREAAGRTYYNPYTGRYGYRYSYRR